MNQQLARQKEVMVRRNSRSEARSGSNSVAYQNLSGSSGPQLGYYQNDFVGHFKNSRANNPTKSDSTEPKLNKIQKYSVGGHRNSRSVTNNVGLTTQSGKALIQGS